MPEVIVTNADSANAAMQGRFVVDVDRLNSATAKRQLSQPEIYRSVQEFIRVLEAGKPAVIALYIENDEVVIPDEAHAVNIGCENSTITTRSEMDNLIWQASRE